MIFPQHALKSIWWVSGSGRKHIGQSSGGGGSSNSFLSCNSAARFLQFFCVVVDVQFDILSYNIYFASLQATQVFRLISSPSFLPQLAQYLIALVADDNSMVVLNYSWKIGRMKGMPEYL